ncbi:pyruvate dehydrogenase phosphatase regulatory subunit, mitochondrial-like [Ylistrum balloti]|uniref:pyruvate dehydrogenase phosphatase regulatory subunit, mitochondrial-like n=1 Tax=Ylistrum balloti TaxID=509963 RepID=UPI0029058EB6|nr:pyruvate dehydrogenase phosphatase regulatory subunit, mitochondrial-like [Ylistrum balloti]
MLLRRGIGWSYLFALNNTRRFSLARLSCKDSRQVASQSISDVTKHVPSSARVVICGGGVLGTSVAYHLTERGWSDVVLLEQGSLTCGTTWHSAGLIGQLGKDDIGGCQLIGYGLRLYKNLEKSHGIGWKQCGSLLLAQTKDRLVTIERKHSLAKALGVESYLVSPSEILGLCPWIKTTDLQGGLWVPGDGVVAPNDLVYAYNSVAKSKGVQVFEGVKLEDVHTADNKVTGVKTSHGHIQCEYFVNCSGQWARHLGARSIPPVQVPLHSNEHFYIVSLAIPNMDSMMPVIRDYDGSIYAREWSGGLLAGGFELEGKPTFSFGMPEKFEFQLLSSDWDHFQVILEPILNRFPAMETAEVRTLVNGPESFTADGNWILGESAEVKNYFVAAGMNGLGVVGSAGIGKYITESIVDGAPSSSLDAHHILRHNKAHCNRRFLHERVKEVIGAYKLRYPYTHWTRGRKIKTSPIHTLLERSGACFGDLQGYERPLYFRGLKDKPFDPYHLEEPTFRKPSWFDDVEAEYRACKDSVCLIDTSCFTMCEVKSDGGEALQYLQDLCCNNISGKAGHITSTGMLNQQGGYVVDGSVVSLAPNRFLITATTNHQRRMLTWMRRHLPSDGTVDLVESDSSFSSLTIIGPRNEALMGDLCDVSILSKDFHPMTCKILDVGFSCGIRTMRIPLAGNDAFTLHVPTENTLQVYEALKENGKKYDIKEGGHYVMKHLRLENKIASQEEDISSSTTPLECGKSSNVCLEKTNSFLGREALELQTRNGTSKQLVHLTLKDLNIECDTWPWGGEPIYQNDQCVGSTSSCGFNFDLRKVICLGYVNTSSEQDGGNKDNYKLAIGTKMYNAAVEM